MKKSGKPSGAITLPTLRNFMTMITKATRAATNMRLCGWWFSGCCGDDDVDDQ